MNINIALEDLDLSPLNVCAFRRKAATVSDPKRPPIPI
jgi:hypothetical protein